MATVEAPITPVSPAPVVDGVELVAPPDDSFLDPRSYFSDAVFELEMRAVLPRSWIFICDVADVAAPGDYVTESVGHEPVVVVRGHDGVLRAFSNVCTHRASLVLDGAANCGKTMVCPYHGWSYRLDGELIGIPYRHDLVRPVDTGRLGLKPIRMEIWERWVFVNVSGDAPTLSNYLEQVPSSLGRHELTNNVRGHRLDDTVNANWKVLMDNAFCDYHLPVVHAESLGKFVDPPRVSETVWKYTGRVSAPSNPQRPRQYEVLPQLEGLAREGSLAFSVFPNWFIVAFPNGSCTVMWWNPITIARTRARVCHYTREAESDPRAGRALLQQIQTEDYAICEKVQKGLRSALYRTGPQHRLEVKIGGYQRLLMEMLSEAARDGQPRTDG